MSDLLFFEGRSRPSGAPVGRRDQPTKAAVPQFRSLKQKFLLPVLLCSAGFGIGGLWMIVAAAAYPRAAVELSVFFMLSLGFMSLVAYRWLVRTIVQPLEGIDTLLRHQGDDDGAPWVAACADDEMGAIASAARDALRRAAELRFDLLLQKCAAAQRPIVLQIDNPLGARRTLARGAVKFDS